MPTLRLSGVASRRSSAPSDPPPRAVILDAGANGDRIDITGAETMTSLVTELHAAGIDVAFAEVRLPVVETARRSGLLDAVGEDRVFHTIQEAVQALGPR